MFTVTDRILGFKILTSYVIDVISESNQTLMRAITSLLNILNIGQGGRRDGERPEADIRPLRGPPVPHRADRDQAHQVGDLYILIALVDSNEF